MEIRDYLKSEREKTPLWLKEYQKGDRFRIDKVLSGRVVYYPGSYFNGHAIRTFNSAGYAHVFVYADRDWDNKTARKEMTDPNGFDGALTGYELIDLQSVTERDLTPKGWASHYHPNDEETLSFVRNATKPYCLFSVYERSPDVGESTGEERYVLLFIGGAEGCATYDALFANRGKAPDVLILEEPGMCDNYFVFGRGGAMEQIAQVTNCFPQYILNTTKVWDGYENANCEPDDCHGILNKKINI